MKTEAKPQPKTLVLDMGAKGGTGKTIYMLSKADWLISQGRPFVPFDCDPENQGKNTAFSSFFPDKRVGQLDLQYEEDRNQLLQNTIESEAGLTLVDLPASSGKNVLEWWKNVCTPENLAELNLRVVAVGVITQDSGSFAAISDWAKVMQDSVSYVIVLNRRDHARGERPIEKVMTEYFESADGRQFREVFKPIEIDMPGLYGKAMDAMRIKRLLPSVAASPAGGLEVWDRARVGTWIRKLHEQYNQKLKGVI